MCLDLILAIRLLYISPLEKNGVRIRVFAFLLEWKLNKLFYLILAQATVEHGVELGVKLGQANFLFCSARATVEPNICFDVFQFKIKPQINTLQDK